jgi:hypothetical protein
MKLKYAITVLTILQTVFGFQLKAQSASADSSVFLSGISNVTALYHKATGEQSHLYNGIEYVGYPFRLDKGHLYFEKNELSRGTVRYDGVQYEIFL